MQEQPDAHRTTLTGLSTPAKALATCIILTLGFGMMGALGQIYIHDIIPTFFTTPDMTVSDMPSDHDGMKMQESAEPAASPSGRGDLFSDMPVQRPIPKDKPIYENEQFVWTLKWSHIHLFGMNMIFILMGAITLLLDISVKSRTWLVVLPFAGILTDIAAMWLKGFVSPAFFWLHIPGGGVFGVVFLYVSLRALWEMWGRSKSAVAAQ